MAGRKARGERAREVVATVDVLPPDTKGKAILERPARFAGVPETPGVTAWKQGLNPRAVRRRIMEAMRAASPQALVTLEKLMQDDADTRVQLGAVALNLSYVVGKPGEVDESPVEGIGGDFDMALLTPAEREELNDAFAVIARMKALALSRAQQ